MNCNELSKMLFEGATCSTLPDTALNHLETCASCRTLVSALEPRLDLLSPSLKLQRHIELSITTGLQRVRPIPKRMYLFAALVALLAGCVALAVKAIGAYGLAVKSPLQVGLILACLTLSTLVLASSLISQIVPGSPHYIRPGLIPFAISILIAVAMASVFQFQEEARFWFKSWVCICVGTSMAVLSVLPVWLIVRRGAVLTPVITTAATGLLAGLAGTTLLELHCPNLNAGHILLSHLGVAGIGMLTGLTAGIFLENRSTVTK